MHLEGFESAHHSHVDSCCAYSSNQDMDSAQVPNSGQMNTHRRVLFKHKEVNPIIFSKVAGTREYHVEGQRADSDWQVPYSSSIYGIQKENNMKLQEGLKREGRGPWGWGKRQPWEQGLVGGDWIKALVEA